MSEKSTLSINSIETTELSVEKIQPKEVKNETNLEKSNSLNNVFQVFLSFLLPLIGLVSICGIWYFISVITGNSLPTPLATFKVIFEMVKDPFYDNGPNDRGIGLQLLTSLKTVLIGFLCGSVVAIPLGVAIGANKYIKQIFYPIVQLLKPVSPLAWFPIGLTVFKDTGLATIFIVFITSLWSTLINTSFGVASVPDDFKNVAKVFGFSKWKYVTKILLPYSLPNIVTGLKLSIGVAWLVIVAGEMLSGGAGIGFFVWDSWNALSLERVIAAIIIIGSVGLLLDRLFTFIEKKVSYK